VVQSTVHKQGVCGRAVVAVLELVAVGSWEAAVETMERQHGVAGCESCASCILWRGSMVLQAVRAVQVVSCGEAAWCCRL